MNFLNDLFGLGDPGGPGKAAKGPPVMSPIDKLVNMLDPQGAMMNQVMKKLGLPETPTWMRIAQNVRFATTDSSGKGSFIGSTGEKPNVAGPLLMSKLLDQFDTQRPAPRNSGAETLISPSRANAAGMPQIGGMHPDLGRKYLDLLGR